MAYVAMTPREEADNLRETVAMLNDTDERVKDWQGKNWSYDDAVCLRRMVRALIDASRSLRKVQPSIAAGLLVKIKLKDEDRQRLEKFIKRITVTTEPNGRLLVIDFYGRDTAAMHFTRLIRNSKRSWLRGPCAVCPKWYVSTNGRKIRLYCSRKCAAVGAQRHKRKRDHNRKIEKAKATLKNFPGRPARFAKLDWKRYVAKATGVSRKFLTVAVRNGELLPPKAESHVEVKSNFI